MFIDFFFSIGVSLTVLGFLGPSTSAVCAGGLLRQQAAQHGNAVRWPMSGTEYCTGSGGCDEYISRVQIGGINQASACAGYEDQSAVAMLVTAGQSYSLTVTNGNPIYAEDCCAVWVDWNNDYLWSPDELCGVVSGVGPYQFTITVPPGGSPGVVRMRIRIDWNNPAPQPCGATAFGEVEDYSLLIAAGTLYGACCDPLSGICVDGAPSTECQSVGRQFHFDTACEALVPACGDPGACCSDILESCEEDVPELSCAATRFVPGAACGELMPPCGDQEFTFVFEPGTGPPPAMACGLTLTPLAPDPRPLFDDVTSIPTPCPGATAIGFSIPLNHRRIGTGWDWWSHGYTGDVYYTNWQDELTLTLPAGACAVYFYLEPGPYSLETFRLQVNGFAQSEPFSVQGASAAYVGVCGTDLQTIHIICTSSADFAIGEFGIACYCGVELCACCDEAAGRCREGVDILVCAQDPAARFIIGGTCNQFHPPCGGVSGACCYGEECELQRPSVCAGEYFGDGSACSPNPCICADQVVNAPGTWSGTTCGMHNNCDMSSTPEVFFEVHIPHSGLWQIDLCGSRFQAELAFGETCCDTFGYDQDACGDEPYLQHVLSPGSYFVTIEGWTGCGQYTLNVTELQWGACCYVDTTLCLDFVLPPACHGVHTPEVLCAALDPPCVGPTGACCDDSSAACVQTSLALCSGRFAPALTCDDLRPDCGTWRPCPHHVDLYDSYGDGWTGNTLDLYVNNSPVLAGITLPDGAGPVSYGFEAAEADEIRTIFHAYGEWPEEAYYVIVGGHQTVLVQDGDGATAPSGVVIAGDCLEPCGDLDQDYDVDLADYDLFFDSLGWRRGEAGYLELADLDHDGCVTMADFELWLQCYEQYAD